ncbi:hypothetical protein C8Q74DRAFT_593375 [Fomes fomentarius]|nr:hypothetical protein C8Q74DRAFT_593375 [Fomes fomentarius]
MMGTGILDLHVHSGSTNIVTCNHRSSRASWFPSCAAWFGNYWKRSVEGGDGWAGCAVFHFRSPPSGWSTHATVYPTLSPVYLTSHRVLDTERANRLVHGPCS